MLHNRWQTSQRTCYIACKVAICYESRVVCLSRSAHNSSSLAGLRCRPGRRWRSAARRVADVPSRRRLYTFCFHWSSGCCWLFFITSLNLFYFGTNTLTLPDRKLPLTINISTININTNWTNADSQNLTRKHVRHIGKYTKTPLRAAAAAVKNNLNRLGQLTKSDSPNPSRYRQVLNVIIRSSEV